MVTGKTPHESNYKNYSIGNLAWDNTKRIVKPNIKIPFDVWRDKKLEAENWRILKEKLTFGWKQL